MIRPLREEDRKQTIDFLAVAPERNLYQLGNIEALGFDREFCQFWGSFDPSGRLLGVLNRYMSGWVIFGEPTADWEEMGRIVDEHAVTAERLQDNPVGIDSFLPYLHRYRAVRVSVEELMALDAADFRPLASPASVRVRRATEDDLSPLVAFYADAEHMSRSPAAVVRPLHDRRIWLAEQAGRIRAAALTNAETADQAMIGGVYTQPAARGQGLSQAVCSALCAELLAEGLHPVLYWKTPAAGVVYHKLGFHPIGQWRSIRLEKIE